ncbi:MAG: ATP-dependent DNA helicase [Lachnospiraceae bacterium]|nr:ATP-dependent DNA helicase [Lachnospiraceae bacterium]
MKEKWIAKISVRNLVEFILRAGDIDNRTAGSSNPEAMQQGNRIHRKIQQRMGSDYRAEVPLRIQITFDEIIIQVEGRADGIIEKEAADSAENENNVVTIDEIKGVLKELHSLKEPENVHIAQGKCYAYIYARENGLAHIRVQMTYCQMETEEIKRFVECYDFSDLEEWFFDLVGQYEKWARFAYLSRIQRNESIQKIDFPFPYRQGQKELVTSVYKTILRKKKLFIQAPTGIGKTLATIFPAVKAVGEGLGERIFYLTAKTITRTVAEQGFQRLRAQGLQWKSIVIVAKDKICMYEEANCNPEQCIYAKGHYDRVNDAIYDMIRSFDEISRERMERQAEKYKVCPFEMSLDIALWVDGIICDYNYAFDPGAHLKRFFSGNTNNGYLFLIDEAHNLVERAREMYSAQLVKEDIMAVRRSIKNSAPKLAKQLEVCNQLLLTLKRECETYQLQESVSHFTLKLMHVFMEMEQFLERKEENPEREQVLELFFQIRHFLTIHDALDDNYLIYTELGQDNHFKLKLYCINPATNLQHYLIQGNSTIFFSATLLPIHYYKQLLSTVSDDYAIYAESTFPRENRRLFIGTDVSTKYTKRSVNMYQAYAHYIHQIVLGKKGNYLVFFPSYHFMEEVYRGFEEMADDVEWVLQSRYMSEESREIFLEHFEEEREKPFVGFCVMGGIFSEGIDLTEERLIGAIVIGTGLPQVSYEREILKIYFDQRGMPGFDYAYLYPGMNKVLQSAGRVIRTEKDKGVIALLDERFHQRQYAAVFPREWDYYMVCNQYNIMESIKEFWDE